MIFPNIDPVVHIGPWALQFGPLALRWYALAYVAGILLGWRYALRLTRTASVWGARTPTATALQIDDLVLWITLGIIVGGRLGYFVFYMLMNDDQRAWLAAHPMDVFKIDLRLDRQQHGLGRAQGLERRIDHRAGEGRSVDMGVADDEIGGVKRAGRLPALDQGPAHAARAEKEDGGHADYLSACPFSPCGRRCREATDEGSSGPYRETPHLSR